MQMHEKRKLTDIKYKYLEKVFQEAPASSSTSGKECLGSNPARFYLEKYLGFVSIQERYLPRKKITMN
jgi:hypothetical protein